MIWVNLRLLHGRIGANIILMRVMMRAVVSRNVVLMGKMVVVILDRDDMALNRYMEL